MRSSLPSDRIKVKTQKARPSQQQQQQPQKAVAIPKSKAVLAIESLINTFQTHSPDRKDEKGGCFCQARLHPLSRHGARLCLSCGLVLCNLNPPYAACPSCASPLLAPHARNAAIASLHQELETQLAEEQRKREEHARRIVAAEGSFPTLPTGKPSAPKPPPQHHTVLSLNSKTKKVMVQTRSTAPSPSPSSTPALDPVDEEPIRVPPPSQPSLSRTRIEGRVYVNLLGDSAKYIAPPLASAPEKKSRRNRKKNNEVRTENWYGFTLISPPKAY